jgi:putative transposase
LRSLWKKTSEPGAPASHGYEGTADVTKECHCIHSDRAIKATDVLAVLEEAIEEHGAPEYIRSDNGPEFIATAIQQWLREKGIKTI